MIKIIGVIALILLGGFMLLFMRKMICFQVWSQRVMVGAQFIPSQRTYTVIRVLGAFFVLIGILVGMS